jgi:hypothetical protein
MQRENDFSFVDEKKRGITNISFQSYPIRAKCIIQCIMPILMVFEKCPFDNID